MNLKSKSIILKELFLFSEITKNRNISVAAKKIGMEQSNLSTAIKDLEGRLGMKLLNRSHNGTEPTEEGKIIYGKVGQMEDILYEICNHSLTPQHQLTGNIKVWTTDGLGAWCLSRPLVNFYNTYPDISLEIICSDNFPNMERHDADVALIYTEPQYKASNKVFECTVKFGLYVSRDYIVRYGLPHDMQDLLENHKICDRSNFRSVWKEWDELLSKAKKVVTTCNSSNIFMHLTKYGAGIGLQPKMVAKMDPDLIPVCPDFEVSHPLWIIIHRDAQKLQKIEFLLEYIRKSIAE